MSSRSSSPASLSKLNVQASEWKPPTPPAAARKQSRRVDAAEAEPHAARRPQFPARRRQQRRRRVAARRNRREHAPRARAGAATEGARARVLLRAPRADARPPRGGGPRERLRRRVARREGAGPALRLRPRDRQAAGEVRGRAGGPRRAHGAAAGRGPRRGRGAPAAARGAAVGRHRPMTVKRGRTARRASRARGVHAGRRVAQRRHRRRRAAGARRRAVAAMRTGALPRLRRRKVHRPRACHGRGAHGRAAHLGAWPAAVARAGRSCTHSPPRHRRDACSMAWRRGRPRRSTEPRQPVTREIRGAAARRPRVSGSWSPVRACPRRRRPRLGSVIPGRPTTTCWCSAPSTRTASCPWTCRRRQAAPRRHAPFEAAAREAANVAGLRVAVGGDRPGGADGALDCGGTSFGPRPRATARASASSSSARTLFCMPERIRCGRRGALRRPTTPPRSGRHERRQRNSLRMVCGWR